MLKTIDLLLLTQAANGASATSEALAASAELATLLTYVLEEALAVVLAAEKLENGILRTHLGALVDPPLLVELESALAKYRAVMSKRMIL